MDRDRTSTNTHTLLLGLLFLFFIQVLGLWVENLFRMSLIKISLGYEMFSIVFLFLPAVFFLAGPKKERPLILLSLLVFLLARAVCPLLGAAALVVAAGIGVGAFLIVFCGIVSSRCPLNADWGRAAAFALLLSVLFRSWGSSIDISMDGNTAVIGWVLVIGTLVLARNALSRQENTEVVETRSRKTRMLHMAGVFANFTIIYLVLSSPAVVSAWCGSNYLLNTALLALGTAAALLWPKPFSTRAQILWNVLFIALLAGGLLWCAPDPPATFQSPASIAEPLPRYIHIPFYLMLLLSPIVFVNLARLGALRIFAHPRDAAGPVIAGIFFLFAITVLLIITNCWGYTYLIGPLLRNRFYLPFLMAGIVMLAPMVTASWKTTQPVSIPGRIGWALAAGILGMFSVIGVVTHASKPAPPNRDKTTLTIMTYNIQQGSTVNGDRSFRRQLELMRKLNPDIIGLQESDTARPSGGNIDCVRYFAGGLNYHAYYGPNTVAGTFGTAILSRFPLENPRTIFSFSNTDEVGTAAAEITVGGTHIAFFNSHPDGYDKSHAAHAEALIEHAAPYARVIAVGDYNCTRHDSWYEDIAAVLNNSWSSVHDVNEPVGEPYSRPIDHIFLSPNFRTLESHYIPPPESYTDHPAHWSIIAWN